MADRSLVARIRASGGPSHDLLVLLDQHRVTTTVQLARASGVPERTARYRIERLHSAGLVDFARPGRERGSAPRHWWLRPSGARLVGINVTGWLTDRAGWQEWTRVGRWSSHPSRLTPDAVGSVRSDGAEVAAFIEVDRTSRGRSRRWRTDSEANMPPRRSDSSSAMTQRDSTSTNPISPTKSLIGSPSDAGSTASALERLPGHARRMGQRFSRCITGGAPSQYSNPTRRGTSFLTAICRPI